MNEIKQALKIHYAEDYIKELIKDRQKRNIYPHSGMPTIKSYLKSEFYHENSFQEFCRLLGHYLLNYIDIKYAQSDLNIYAEKQGTHGGILVITRTPRWEQYDGEAPKFLLLQEPVNYDDIKDSTKLNYLVETLQKALKQSNEILKPYKRSKQLWATNNT